MITAAVTRDDPLFVWPKAVRALLVRTARWTPTMTPVAGEIVAVQIRT